MDAYQRATLLRADAGQYLENIFVPDNLRARTRAGADTLTAAPGGLAGLIQGLIFFTTSTYQQLLAGSGGKIWQ